MKFLTVMMVLWMWAGLAWAGPTNESPVWAPELAVAQTRARAESKAVLIHFSGSDWCGWCIKLRKEVFARREFEDYAKTNLILVRIDFPKHKPLPTAVQAANQKVAQQYDVQGFPTLVLLDSQGTRLGNINYAQGGTKVFLGELEKLLHPVRDLPPTKTPAARAPIRQAKHENMAAEVQTDLTLKRITGSRKTRHAVINDQALALGQTANIKVGDSFVQVQCLEIRDKSVVVIVNGARERRELKLARGI
jgi:protein disulfide-isomerase